MAGAVAAVRAVLGDFDGQNVVDRAGYGYGVSEGRSFFLGVGPGVVHLRSCDLARSVRASERLVARAETLTRLDVSERVTTPEGPLCAHAMATVFRRRGASCGHPSCDARVWIGDGTGKVRDPYGAVIREWSDKSRQRLFRSVLGVDFSTWGDLCCGHGTCEAAARSGSGPLCEVAAARAGGVGDLCMVTLTLPGDWLAVAPSGREFKRLVEVMRRRWVRAGLDWRCVWKLEFQRRGAPHWHALMRVPALVGGVPFHAWLSATWADVVGADDSYCHGCGVAGCSCSEPDTERARHLLAGTAVDFGKAPDCRDPLRVAVYFLGHSAKHTDGKEYQHVVPDEWAARGAGPGRFWGICGFGRAVLEVELDQRAFYWLRRVMRHVERVRAVKRDRLRAARGLPPVKRRRRASLGARGGVAGGWVSVNDGVLLAYALARLLSPPAPGGYGAWVRSLSG